jgi:hypothetical protein
MSSTGAALHVCLIRHLEQESVKRYPTSLGTLVLPSPPQRYRTSLCSPRTHVFQAHTLYHAMPPQPIISVQDQLPTNTTDTTNSTSLETSAIPVVCAWPVSGQYGPGSRILFYVLIAACLIARKNEWIRNACLAGALLLPAVAALHAITLATLHNPGKRYSARSGTYLLAMSHRS